MSEGAGVRDGWVAPEVAGEFPELRLSHVAVAARPGRSPRDVKQRLKLLSDRFRGPQAVTMRQQPIPWAYRVFFRHIGLDPDTDRPPGEALAVERLLRGRVPSRNLLDDALAIALVETGVPVWALDADRVSGGLGIRPARRDEPLGRGDGPLRLPGGRLAVVDDEGPVAVLFGEVAAGHGVTRDTRRMVLFAVGVAGVPAIHVEEALWTVQELLLMAG